MTNTLTYKELKLKQLLDLFSPDGPQHTTGPSLRGHIVNAHFQMQTLAKFGVARYDIEVAKLRGFDLDWVVKKAMERMERTEDEIARERQSTDTSLQLDPTEYRTILAKNLLFIQQLGLANIDWARVERTLPNVAEITLDLSKDTKDASYKAIHSARMERFAGGYYMDIENILPQKKIELYKNDKIEKFEPFQYAKVKRADYEKIAALEKFLFD